MSGYGERIMHLFAVPEAALTATEAAGTRIKTLEWGELVDFESGCWAAVLGHCRKELAEVMHLNAGRLFHTHQFFSAEHPGALVEELIKAAGVGCSYKGTFMSSGSEAVSLAVALAETISGRPRKLSLSISYHGALPGLRMPRKPEEWLDLDVRECLNCPNAVSCRECGKFAWVDFSEFCAFVFEPGNSGGAVFCPPEKLTAYICEEVRRAGGYVIVNEVTTGFGRTGKWFGFQHYNAFASESGAPDFIALGKGLGNGYPVSCLLTRPNLAELAESSGYRYVQSHTDDPLGCSVARKVVEIIARENLVERGNESGLYLRARLAKTGERTGGIAEIRGRGLMNVAVLTKEYKAKEVFKALLTEGFFTGYSEVHNFIHLYPPMIISHEEIDGLCSALEHILQV